MKKRCIFLTASLLIFSILISTAQNFDDSGKDWMNGWTNFSPNKTEYPEAQEILPSTISTHTYLRNDVVYLISGNVYVTSGASLTIQEGTIIRCDHMNPATLFVAKGAKLVAVGTKSNPIVFTSNKAPKARDNGDWGGIIIAGSGTVNKESGIDYVDGDFNTQFTEFGGYLAEEETAMLRYVRIEFAGNKTKKNVNGLSLYGIGTYSFIDNVMISYSGQNSFYFNAGKNNVKNLVSYKAEESDFLLSEGFKGNLNTVVAIRHPYVASPKGSFALEIDGHSNKNTNYVDPTLLTDVTLTNASFISLSDKTNYKYTTPAIYTKNSARTYINNTKISGFSDVVKFDKSYTSLPLIQKAFMMDNSFFNIHGEGVKIANGQIIKKESLDILKYNRFTKSFADAKELFLAPNNSTNPNFKLKKSLNTYMVMQ